MRYAPMAVLNAVCVYCGSGTGADPIYVEAARELGRRFAESGIRLVYGGGSVGLMGELAAAVLRHGGHVTGIIPRFLSDRERLLHGVDELIVTEDMHARKRLMFERAEAFVALPGGIGTLEELVEILTWSQLGRHEKPVLLANIGGFWNPLLALFDHMTEQGFIRPGLTVAYVAVDRVADIVPTLQEAVRGVAQAALDAPPLNAL
jgi:uncharacterized protein (TIGR00730 family)